MAIFIPQIILAYLTWFFLRKKFKATNQYYIAIISCIIPMIFGFVMSYRIIGYTVAINYLTQINNEKIETTGYGITLEEENLYKEELKNNKQFMRFLSVLAVKGSSIPSIITINIMLLIARRRREM